MKRLHLSVLLLLGASVAWTARSTDVSNALASSAVRSSTNEVAYAPAVLPGNGLAQHPFLYAGEWDFRKPVQTIFLVRDGKVAWSYDIPTKDANGQLNEFSDATMLSNGNVVFARKTGAGEITPDKKLIWNYDAPAGTEVHVVQPLGTNRVMFVQNGNPAKLMIVDISTGKLEKELTLPVGNTNKVHGQFRRVRMTKAGTFLAAHMDNNKISEYDADGKEIWSVAERGPWAATRLASGNTLITQQGFVRELNAKGETVWSFSQKDLPGIRLFIPQEANRLANGNTVISSWCPLGIKNTNDWSKSVQVIEVTPEKKVVWALRSWDDPANLGPATCIQLLDEPGVPENPGDMAR
jgi:hypothetical protein